MQLQWDFSISISGIFYENVSGTSFSAAIFCAQYQSIEVSIPTLQ